jgi:hypothetical protein
MSEGQVSDWRPGVNGQRTPMGPSYPGYPPGDPPVVKIDLGLTGKQILAALGGLVAIITSGITAGYIFVPAKQQDLVALQNIVRPMQIELVRVAGSLERAAESLSRIEERQRVVLDRLALPPDVSVTPGKH